MHIHCPIFKFTLPSQSMWLPGAPQLYHEFAFQPFLCVTPHSFIFFCDNRPCAMNIWICFVKSSVPFSFFKSFPFLKAYMTSILPTEPTVIFMYDFWLHLVYRTYDPLWVLTLYLANLINLLVNVILRATYLYILNIACEWWVFSLCPHFMLPSWLIKLSTRLNWQQRNVCRHEENIHHVMPTAGFLQNILSLLICKAGNLQVCDLQDDLSTHSRYLGDLTTLGSVLHPTNSWIQSSECRFNYLHQRLVFMN